MAFQESDLTGVLHELSNAELAAMALEREQAEAAGVFDDWNLTDQQEYDLWSAASTLASLMKETNSTLSELLEKYGYTDLV